ncbi:hypothetical protein NY08_2247 [Rhodococcus sp. B7740]|nr:hypothetical protein NY08_2247 [Rhodococcus sp. B7740]
MVTEIEMFHHAWNTTRHDCSPTARAVRGEGLSGEGAKFWLSVLTEI